MVNGEVVYHGDKFYVKSCLFATLRNGPQIHWYSTFYEFIKLPKSPRPHPFLREPLHFSLVEVENPPISNRSRDVDGNGKARSKTKWPPRYQIL
jgi:hypothetical protein